LLRDPRQNARWQHAIFVKVNNKTTAVSPLKRPRKPQRGTGGRRGQERLRCKHPSSLQTPASGPPSTNCPAPQTFLGEEVKRWGDPPSTRLRHLLLGAPGPAWLISRARHPAPSICPSSNCISHTGAQLPSGLPDRSHRGQTVPPFPPTGVCSKDHPGGCSEKLKEKLHPPYAPSQGSLKSFPEPHTQSAEGSSSYLELISVHKGRAT